jgi:ABC-2 type transport system permease protein
MPVPLRERENIETVQKLHKQILADKRKNQERRIEGTERIYFMYELENGRKVIRQYQVNT